MDTIALTRAESEARQHWWDEGGGHQPANGYDDSDDASKFQPGPDGILYRPDCSGYYGMTLAINTGTISSGYYDEWPTIDPAKLQQGDAIIAPAYEHGNTDGHVVRFESWATDSGGFEGQGSLYNASEFGGGDAPLHRAIPYPYDDGRTWFPIGAPFPDPQEDDLPYTEAQLTTIVENAVRAVMGETAAQANEIRREVGVLLNHVSPGAGEESVETQVKAALGK